MFRSWRIGGIAGRRRGEGGGCTSLAWFDFLSSVWVGSLLFDITGMEFGAGICLSLFWGLGVCDGLGFPCRRGRTKCCSCLGRVEVPWEIRLEGFGLGMASGLHMARGLLLGNDSWYL